MTTNWAVYSKSCITHTETGRGCARSKPRNGQQIRDTHARCYDSLCGVNSALGTRGLGISSHRSFDNAPYRKYNPRHIRGPCQIFDALPIAA